MRNEENSVKSPTCSANLPSNETKTNCYCPNCSVKQSISDENERIAVYASLRNEIVSTQAMRTTMIVYMFTVYFVLYGLGFDKNQKLCFVATYAVLIAFQAKIVRLKYTITRISFYIKKNFEEKRDDSFPKWETTNLDNCLLRTNNRVVTVLSCIGAILLGLLSLVTFLLITWKELDTCIISWPCSYKICAGACFFGLLTLIIIGDEYYINEKEKDKIRTQLNKINRKTNETKQQKAKQKKHTNSRRNRKRRS